MIPQLKTRTSQKPAGQENEPEASRKKSKKKWFSVVVVDKNGFRDRLFLAKIIIPLIIFY